MLAYHNPQINTTSKFFSSIPQNKRKSDDSKVIYKTETELSELVNIGFKYLQNENTLRPTSAGVVFKIIMGRLDKLGKCVTKIKTFGSEMVKFKYDKLLGERQIKRVIKRLNEIGLITYERSIKWDMRSPYQYKATKLGWDMYMYFYKNNNCNTKYINLNLSTPQNLSENKCHLEMVKNDPSFVQMSPREFSVISKTPMITDPVLTGDFTNVTSILDIKNKKDINIHTRARAIDNPEGFFVFDPDPDPDEEEQEMFVEYPTHNFTPDQTQVIKEILSNGIREPSDEGIFKDELAQELDKHLRRGIQIVDFKYFANAVMKITQEKYYWDMRRPKETH